MARLLKHLVPILVTCLLTVGAAPGMVAAENNRFGSAEFPETAPVAPRAAIAPAAAPALAPVAPETKAAKPGVIGGIIPAIRRIFTIKRGSTPAAETPPPVVASRPQVAAAETIAPSAEASIPVASAPAPAVKPAAHFLAETPPLEPMVPTSSSRFSWLKRNRELTASVPALVAGGLPVLRLEARRSRAPNLPRQTRLDMDQRIEKLGPELEPISGSDVMSGASLSAAVPVAAGVEETVITLEAAAAVQAKTAGTAGAVGTTDRITRRSEEIKLIPSDTKQREQFREVILFFDPPPPKASSSAQKPTSSATYEQK
jgi:hypothetical protein